MKLINFYEAVSTPEPSGSSLTSRETDVLGLLVRGFSNQQIADSLGVSFYTATSHLKNIYKKLGVHKRTEAIVKVLAGSLAQHKPNPAAAQHYFFHGHQKKQAMPQTLNDLVYLL